ncbi:MAG: hypothetical protein JXP36_03190 [Bacteroidales bacterium]|nr:hypothetical protein [Bacteroidales bacterium]
MDTMRNFNILTLDSTRDDLLSIEDYDFGSFELTKLWLPKKIDEDISNIKFYTDNLNSDITDAVGNPLSLFIFSDKMINLLFPFLNEDAQVISLELINNNTKDKIKGFNLLHPFKAFKCIDIKNSGVSYSGGNEISIVGDCVIREKEVPTDVHIFRVEEDKNTVIVSDELAKSLVGKDVNGIAFIRCKCV